MKLFKLNQINPHIEILDIDSPRFIHYGKTLNYDFSQLIGYMSEKIPIPSGENIYITSDESMEAFKIKNVIESEIYGEMPVQIGYCCGNNRFLNGLEYHKCHEINVAVTDLVLLLGRLEDISNSRFLSEKVEAFYLPKGAAVELYCTTLHFSPCMVDEGGFKCIVILQRETNLPLADVRKLDELDEPLFARNKWLLVHKECGRLIQKGARIGIDGDNIKINCLED